ncbi:MAG TPA: glycosyltransferase [Stellaceae bacterium]|nr:glycosyltransferase [Stellaceae bacterium]
MKPVAVFVWDYLGPYHVDRLTAAGAALAETHRVVAVEIAGSSETYAWSQTGAIPGVERVTLFPGGAAETLPWWRVLPAFLRLCWGLDARHVFLCNYNRPEYWLLAIALRLWGRRAYVMFESKFDDYPRQLWRELLKAFFFLPYNGGIVGGTRSRDYLRWFGFRPRQIALGYDTVSMERVRQLAAAPPAPDGAPFPQRHFVIVARLVPKKNVAMALEAYARYCRTVGPSARELHICGSGALESALEQRARELGLTKAVFRGFIQAPDIARTLAMSLALILPSTEEQWGLVVNEALAMGLPVLCSSNVGARDLLVRTEVNGFVFEPENAEGLARLMQRLGDDEALWRRLAESSRRLAPLADVKHFGSAAARLVGPPAREAPGLEDALSMDAP